MPPGTATNRTQFDETDLPLSTLAPGGGVTFSLIIPRRPVMVILSMPTGLRKGGFEVKIHFNDHEPAHVHVFKGGGEVKVQLDPVTVVRVWNMNKPEARRAKRLVVENRAQLLEKWGAING